MLKWTHYARKHDIGLLYPNMEIRPQAPKMEFFKKVLFLKRSPDFASNEPSTTSRQFKSSYARKLNFGLLCPNMEIRPQAPKMDFFKKVLFLKRSPDFASNEPSTTPRH